MSSTKAEKNIGKAIKQSVAKNLLKKARDIIVSSSDTIKHTAMKAVEGTALVLVSMFFVIQLCNDAMLLKIQSYEQVFKLFLSS